ncbi:PPE family protein [Mycobacterium paragordonae]|uniref:PPE family protein n=1 Tax=Mycobacterium paragordonae TaxID=1389713 RepID=A0AAJ1SC97_9MYCO|nr:PPE family protein [Mycobacterium paragordonae]MDP7739079.1 PPE family protein [Mycobacterium paragordonae]TDK94333.1 PPE family protein [Mycobacterium paragordonae]GFG81150.1 PPE family protein PPE15 [Mycobacterium paragordonae]
MSYAGFPPEVNSGLMYSGAGAGPFMAAAAAWNNLASELSTTAAQYESIITSLTTEQWTGAGSASAAAAAQPYVEWLTTTATAAEQAGIQAAASAAAYEAAFTATVPPPVIAANRALLAALVATNFLGINTPAIMATEAQYMEMWVQDVVAMTTYQAGAAAAAVLEPLVPATQTTNPGGAGAQAAAVSAAQAVGPAASLGDIVTGLQSELSNLTLGTSSIGTGLFNALPVPVQEALTALDGFLGTPLIFNGIQQVGVTASWFMFAAIPNGIFAGHTIDANIAAAAAEAAAPAAAAAEGAAAGLASEVGAAGALGEASLVGSLSVPASWAGAAPVAQAAGTALAGSGWTVPEEGAAPGMMAGMPGMAAAAKGAGAYAGPRYGFKPIVMPKQVVV